MSGTPPAELLYTAPVTYDLGGELAKVYEPNRDKWDVAAFHWGNLTSKSSISAFWILLAPFAMANVAGWMSEAPNVWSRIWIRVAGLSLTGIFFAQLGNMAFDVPLASGSGEIAVRWIYLGLCVLAIIGLGLVSTQSNFRPIGLGERLRYLFLPSVVAMNPVRQEPAWGDPAGSAQLAGSAMWTIHSIDPRLRRIHLTLGMAVLALIPARAVGSAGVDVAAVTLAGVMLVALALTTGPTASNRVVLWATALAPAAGVAVVGSAILELFGGDIVNRSVADEVTYEIALILGAGAGLGLMGEWVKSRSIFAGWVPVGLLAVAAFIGANLGLTGAMLVETYLTESRSTTETFDSGASFVTLGMLGMSAVIAVALAVAMAVRREGGGDSAFRRGVLRARMVLGVVGLYAILAGIAAVWTSCEGPAAGCTQRNIDVPTWMFEDRGNLVVLFGLPFDPTSWLGWAKLLMVAVPATLILRSIVGGLLNGQDRRRKVGILWDLGSFWPRWFHPLAPPGYGPYAVNRMQTVLEELEPDVLAAHSQGSLIAAVAISLVPEDAVPRLFVTYGSQIGDLYPSLFPSIGFDQLIASTDAQLGGRWVNLWRGSDSIGGQVIPALGERNWEVRTGAGHSGYELTPEFCAARKCFDAMVLTRPSDDVIADCWKGR